MRFVLRRLLEALFALVCIAAVIFFVLHLDHLDPARGLLGKFWTPQRGAALDAQLGLNKPLLVQFVLWMRGLVLVGGLGQVIVHYLPPTAEILVIGGALGALAAIVMVRLQTRHPDGMLDRSLNVAAGMVSALPGFFVGGLLLYLLAAKWTIFPPTAMTEPGAGLLSWAYHQVMPVFTLAFTVIGPWSRQLRASMGDVAAMDYVRTARAKGLGERQIISRHMMRNALLPFISMVGLSLPTMVNTLIALEIIYGVQGAGFDLIDSLNSMLFADATTVALVLAFITVLGNLLADFLYGLADPRIEYR